MAMMINGKLYEDEMDYNIQRYSTQDKNVMTPQEYDTNKQLDKAEEDAVGIPITDIGKAHLSDNIEDRRDQSTFDSYKDIITGQFTVQKLNDILSHPLDSPINRANAVNSDEYFANNPQPSQMALDLGYNSISSQNLSR